MGTWADASKGRQTAKPLITKVACGLWKKDAIAGANAQVRAMRTSPAAMTRESAVLVASSILSCR
jgi:hypothetical protein